jgi:putative DNA methylase
MKTNNPLRLIETDDFPFEFISAVAARESWRKEVYRPIYHVHKWWAKRLGSVFRGLLLGCLLPPETDLSEAFYQKHDFSSVTVFDPFMGSGTTVGEAHKLGCIALGRDINPVACESVRVALSPLDRHELQAAYDQLAATVGVRIRELYRTQEESETLYYFWVMQADCPACAATLDLFSNFIFARNAYPNRKPEVQVCCPGCGDVFSALHRDELLTCRHCQLAFNPAHANAQGSKATCRACGHNFPIAATIRATAQQPKHRLYAKLLLTSADEKVYLPATPHDEAAYQAASQQLREELTQGRLRLPMNELADGFNTRQAINYNYRAWRDFFNDRQLLALGWLQEAIAQVPRPAVRDALLTLFSGVLEFNNLFASYKGEGTGAVRHLFAHHILKPERTPLEANVWGTPKSSGSFSNLFKSRLLRALDYREAPFEAALNSSGKTFYASSVMAAQVNVDKAATGDWPKHSINLSCGSSAATSLPDASVDLIVTDPPFFDNVHYSELADFFFAWQSLYPRGFLQDRDTTRHPSEVQDADAAHFAAKLQAVFAECQRILKPNGLLAFTYHHSRADGWTALVEALFDAGFGVVNAHPVKAEMSVAVPKSQAKEPIQLDIIFVCRKRAETVQAFASIDEALLQAAQRTQAKAERLTASGLELSRNDRLIIAISQFIAALGTRDAAASVNEALAERHDDLERLASNVIKPPLMVKRAAAAKVQQQDMFSLFQP